VTFAGGDGLTANSSYLESERETSCLEIQIADGKFLHGDQGLVYQFQYDFGGIRRVETLRTIREL
jgi:hypothetical protein